MKIVDQSYKIVTPIGYEMLKNIERAGRTCYKSEDRITEDSAKRFCKMLINREHTAMLEHAGFTVRFITDRAIANEIVRHRHFSFAQESTRYVKYDEGIEVIVPPITAIKQRQVWWKSVVTSESTYRELLKSGVTPEIARSVLPHCLKTELVVSGNIREWRHFFNLRTDTAAHPQMRELVIPLLKELQSLVPILFDDIEVSK